MPAWPSRDLSGNRLSDESAHVTGASEQYQANESGTNFESSDQNGLGSRPQEQEQVEVIKTSNQISTCWRCAVVLP